MRITSVARTSIELEVRILHQTTPIERIASLQVVWEEVRVVHIYGSDDVFVWRLSIQRLEALDALGTYLINDYLNSLHKSF
jgi:hypothetical protein